MCEIELTKICLAPDKRRKLEHTSGAYLQLKTIEDYTVFQNKKFTPKEKCIVYCACKQPLSIQNAPKSFSAEIKKSIPKRITEHLKNGNPEQAENLLIKLKEREQDDSFKLIKLCALKIALYHFQNGNCSKVVDILDSFINIPSSNKKIDKIDVRMQSLKHLASDIINTQNLCSFFLYSGIAIGIIGAIWYFSWP